MQSDNFDKRVREAADHHHPTYDEKAWQNMEKLLDEHLPKEEDNRRRFIFFLLFFLLLGGTGIWLLTGNSGKRDRELLGSVNPVLENNKIVKDENVLNETNNEKSGTILQIKENPNIQPDQNFTLAENKQIVTSIYKKNGITEKRDIYQEKLLPVNSTNNSSINKSFQTNNTTQSLVSGNEVKNNAEKEVTDSMPTGDITEISKKDKADIKQSENPKTKSDVNADSLAEEKSEIKTSKQDSKKKKSSFFFVSLSAGPDISFVASDKAGKSKLLAGLGLGYTFKNGISVRTGFYSGRKVYTASGDNYNPPAVFYQYYPILEKVNADCKVYEIPINVSYNFGNTRKQNWFAGAGISTFLMKKEEYKYSYKYTASGPSYQSNWTINKENKHFFSVVTISGGYQRQLSKKISITAEPYFKIPLKGVGYGKVKLNSGGVLFTLSVKPFGENKK